ncbi:D-lactonohydrolase-like protein, partial [Obba rivulosa]
MGPSEDGLQRPRSNETPKESSLGFSMGWLWYLAVLAACAAWKYTSAATPSSIHPPPQSVIIDPLDFAALGNNGSFRQSAFTQFFNPTNSTPPFFQVFHEDFLSVLGSTASIRVVASNPGFAFAHEAPIWVPETDEVFFASNDGGALGMSDLNHNNQVSKISLTEVAQALQGSGSNTSAVNVTVTKLDLPGSIQMTNGGTGPFRGSLVLVNSGRGPLPPSVALVNPSPPHNVTILLDNYYGRQFNSLNDVKIHPGSGKLYFTDAPYGFLNQFRGPLLMPNQVYRFDPDTRSVRVVADQFDKSNGIAFSQDGKNAFVTDTGSSGGFLGMNQTRPATIYKYDVDPITHSFANRRVFAYSDTGIPDGIQLDTKGNVYSGCGDGVHVWSPDGTLIGKFFLGTTSANMVFAGKGQLVIMGETAVYLAQIAAEGFNLSLP